MKDQQVLLSEEEKKRLDKMIKEAEATWIKGNIWLRPKNSLRHWLRFNNSEGSNDLWLNILKE